MALLLSAVGAGATVVGLLAKDLERSKPTRYGVLIVLAILSLFSAIIGIYGISGNSQNETPVPIAIDATKEWQSTGITANTGEVLTIIVVGGKWTASNNIWVENNGVGYLFTCDDPTIDLMNCPIPTEDAGALVGRIGDNPPFFVGSYSEITSQYSGMLSLQINDSNDALSDNEGVLAVKIIVH
jgi:hypothetical protein